jgi:cysteine desulfurase
MIYLDYAATTPVDPRVLEVMQPYFSEIFGNPSSIHQLGLRAESALESARHQIAELINAKPEEIIFTSCGSESDNLAIRGAALAERLKRGANHIISSHLEHSAVIKTIEQLEKYDNFEVSWLEPDQSGTITPDSVQANLRPETALVTVMHANNEIGTVNPIADIGKILSDTKTIFHSDAVQGAAHFPLDVELLGVDLLSIGAHKFYGPKGIGVLYRKNGTNLISRQTGGSQEFSLRAGTENVPLIVGMAKAFSLVREEFDHRDQHNRQLRDYLTAKILGTISEVELTGHPEKRLPNHASFVFNKVDGNLLVSLLDQAGFAVSSGSACKTGHPRPSSGLLALGYPPETASSSLRVTVGSPTTKQDLEQFIPALQDSIERIRAYHE